MSNFRIAVPVAAMVFLVPAAVALADDAAEKYVDDALPLMYYSCASVVEDNGGDQAKIEAVVDALTAVSLYNRDVTTAMFDVGDEAKDAMHDKFVAALKKGCEEDKNALLAGVIDKAVADALSGKK